MAGGMGRGNGGQRGSAERPPTQDQAHRSGEDLLSALLFRERKALEALFANERDPAAEFTRCVGLAKQVYRKAAETGRINEASAAAAAIWCMRQKLDPGTDVYFVPYAGNVQPITSPQGLIKLSFRGGFVKDVIARPVFDGETFEYELGTNERILHKKGNRRPVKPGESWNALTYTYAIMKTSTGGQAVEVHDRADIEYYRSLSKTATSPKGMWMQWPAEAARKAVVKQVLKWAPQSAELSAALRENEAEGVEIPDEIWDAIKHKVPGGAPQVQVPEETTGAASPAPQADRSEGALSPEEEERIFAEHNEQFDEQG